MTDGSLSETLHDAPSERRGASESALDLRRLAAEFAADGHIHWRLTGHGVLHIDRPLPFLLVYRAAERDAGTRALVVSEASYLIVGEGGDAEARSVVQALAAASTARFGAFLVLELWAESGVPVQFRVLGPEREAESTMRTLAQGLSSIPLPLPARVHTECSGGRQPPGRSALLDVGEAWRRGTLLLGLAVPPVYRSDAGELFPVFLRRFRAGLSRVLRQTIADFVRVQTVAGPESYRALGPRRVDELAWRADEELGAIERQFDFLLLVAPLDADAAHDRFVAGGEQRAPEFHYRLLPFDPDLLKRRLYAIELERLEDPALAQLLREKRDELDRQITMLALRGTPAFRFGSHQLYGTVTPALRAVAEQVLAAAAQEPAAPASPMVDAWEFERHAQREVEAYRGQLPELRVDIQVRPDVTGVMVSAGRLLIGERLAVAPGRVEALLHHEIGTHVLTWVNGGAQPLRQLQHGLAGYDELQEALGVLAEFLVGGLSPARLRVLAARVLAAASIDEGAEFMDTYRLLRREYGFAGAAAFEITERVHQSGGFTRDVIYLRGLDGLLGLLRDGAPLEPLYLGKLAAAHTDLLAELRERGVLLEPPLQPRFLPLADVQRRLGLLRAGLRLPQLLGEAA